MTSSWDVGWCRTLHLRHNDHDGVSNHQPHGCLLNCLYRRRSKKTSKLRVTGLCVGNSPGPVNSPHKWPVARKIFPFDDVIMHTFTLIASGVLKEPTVACTHVRPHRIRTDAISSTRVDCGLAFVNVISTVVISTPARLRRNTQYSLWMGNNGPLVRYVKLRVAPGPGMPRTFSPPPT